MKGLIVHSEIENRSHWFTFTSIYLLGLIRTTFNKSRISISRRSVSKKTSETTFSIRLPSDGKYVDVVRSERDNDDENINGSTKYDFVILLIDPRDIKKVSDLIRSKAIHVEGAVIVLSRTSYSPTNTFTNQFSTKTTTTKPSQPVVLEGVIGTDVCVRRHKNRDAYEPVVFNGIAMQRLTSDELKRGGKFVRILEALGQYGFPLSYRSGISKSLWGSSVLHTSMQCTAALTPGIPLRRVIYRSSTFRSLLNTMSAELEMVVYATFRNPKGKQWSLDTTGNSVLNLFTFQVWLSLPSCWVAAWSRFCTLFCCNPVGNEIPFGSRTSLQRDLQRCDDVGSSRANQFDIIELRNVLRLARARGLKTPISDRVLNLLLKGGGRERSGVDIETLSEAEKLWARILGNKSGACGLAVRTGSWGLSNLFLHIMKGIFVCVFVWTFMYVQSKFDFLSGS